MSIFVPVKNRGPILKLLQVSASHVVDIFEVGLLFIKHSSSCFRKDTMAAATATRGCPTCQPSVSTCTARPPHSHTRLAQTFSPRISHRPTSPSHTHNPATLILTSTRSTSTPYTSPSRRTSSSRGRSSESGGPGSASPERSGQSDTGPGRRFLGDQERRFPTAGVAACTRTQPGFFGDWR